MNVNDDKASFSDTYTITSTTLSRIIFGGLSYSGIEGLTLNAETGNNTINIHSTAFGVPVTVNAGPGNDTINVGTGKPDNIAGAVTVNAGPGNDTINVGNGNLDNLPGAVTVNGQGGIDTVNVNDTAPFSDTYTITNTTLSRIIFGGLTYSGIENFVLNAETGFNVFNVFGTPLTMTTTINKNGGKVNILGPHGPLIINP